MRFGGLGVGWHKIGNWTELMKSVQWRFGTGHVCLPPALAQIDPALLGMAAHHHVHGSLDLKTGNEVHDPRVQCVTLEFALLRLSWQKKGARRPLSQFQDVWSPYSVAGAAILTVSAWRRRSSRIKSSRLEAINLALD